ncbi:ROK family transcriptional regulator [Nocardioides euryhalodurans]|uniref:ROK family transcriptional regulator n=1 Tax=Nocardioides euryhalodurans TaxID=2518370 RepID=A0A4P7GLC3_9ACTN|nr:ROK family transcriptional regulator [Nocardioides euryhalodurans]QBR92587.1 ROK family transcriptional regulator [Nocardioides euryhalodurans]
MSVTRPPASAPGSTSSLKAANQHRVLDALRDAQVEDDAPTQAELARVTGLAPATVSNIVRELAAAGLVDTVPGSGRRGSAVRLSSRAGVVAGIDFGHSHVGVAVGDLGGRVLAEERARTPDTLGHEQALALASSILTRLLDERGPLRHVGLGLPAPVKNNVVRSAAIFPGWDEVDTSSAAEAVFGVPVDVENDANLGALAEHRQGNGRGHSTSVFVKIASGVGAGIIVDDKLFHGADGTAGEIGHLTINEQGPMCRCGSRGCLETYTSSEHILRLVATTLPDATLQDLVTEATSGNVSAQRALEDAGLHLGWALASLVNLLNPSIVIVGGEMVSAGDLLLEPARTGLRRHALDAVAQTPIVASGLGQRASMVGAVLLAAERTELVSD